jgi:hypothetical protein
VRINQALVAELKGANTDAGDEIYPAPLPATATLPAVTYQRISRVPDYVYAGDNDHGDSGGNESRWQLDLWGKTKVSVEDLAEQVKAHLSGFWGVMGGVDGVTVGWVFMENEMDDFDPEPGRYRIIQEFLIQFEEAVP